MPLIRTAVPTLALFAFLALPVRGQEVRYTETTRTEMGGMMGSVMSMMGGMDEATTDTVTMSGDRMRRDSEGSSTLIDWSTGETVLLDHDAQTFTRFDFSEMAAGMRANAEPSASGEEASPSADVEFSFSSERTGRTDRIAGYDAEQLVTIIHVEGEVPEEERPDTEAAAALGTARMALVTELWLSTDFPAWTLTEASRGEMGEALERAFGPGPDGMAGMQGVDPRMGQAMEEQRQAMEDLEGTPLRSVTNFVMLPGDVELDTDAVLETEEIGGEEMDLGALTGAAAGAAMRDRLGGLFGGGGDDEEAEEGERELGQSIFMRTVSDVGDVEEAPVGEEFFQVPEGYTERALPGGGGR